MKIVKKDSRLVSWDKVKVGEVFLGPVTQMIWMKTSPDVWGRNAICLEGDFELGKSAAGHKYLVYKNAELHLNDNK